MHNRLERYFAVPVAGQSRNCGSSQPLGSSAQTRLSLYPPLDACCWLPRSGVAFFCHFRSFRISFGLVHCSWGMVRRRVNGAELQRCRLRCVDDVMVGARWNHDGIAFPCRVFIFFIENEFGLSPLNAEELVNFGMHLIADRFSRLQAHQDKLGVRGSEEYLPEVCVVQRLFIDWPNIFNQGSRPLRLGGVIAALSIRRRRRTLAVPCTSLLRRKTIYGLGALQYLCSRQVFFDFADSF